MIPAPTLDTLNGWLSPEGRLYPCLSRGHIGLAEQLTRMRGEAGDEHALERRGWVKLQTDAAIGARSQWVPHARRTGAQTWDISELTERQLEAITQWHDLHERVTVLSRMIERSLREQLAC